MQEITRAKTEKESGKKRYRNSEKSVYSGDITLRWVMYSKSPSPTAGNFNAGWLPHAEGLYTQHDDLLYQCMYVILHKERQRLGILNPFASPFYPETERYKYMEQHEKEKNNGKIDGNSTKTTEITAEDPGWIKVHTKKKTGHNSIKRNDEQPQKNTNQYKILSAEESDYNDDESSSSESLE